MGFLGYEVKSFRGYEAKSFLGFEGSRSETQGCYYCVDREYRYVTKD